MFTISWIEINKYKQEKQAEFQFLHITFVPFEDTSLLRVDSHFDGSDVPISNH